MFVKNRATKFVAELLDHPAFYTCELVVNNSIECCGVSSN